MSFAVGAVVQRMRWVPPGRFVMGSPEGEAGRYDNEQQHVVVLRRGFWLADTPCTQGLWQAVMGSNPSRFVSPDRPVEHVSWDDCQAFLKELNDRVRGLGARLPAEAEWEHACRGGTTTATWAADLDIRGAHNAPVLDAIAWYSGNSGVGFELDNGVNSGGWRGKQYPHTRAGTQPVGRKLPNPLGLYDMLGNVFEWCEDWYGPYDVVSVVDPSGPSTGSARMMRGGSWYSYVKSVRAAYRNAVAPGHCDAFLGFRLARGQAPSQGSEPPGARERIRRP
jgi:formylglycine-generating enzyme required for sulfatase activity